MSTKKTPNEVSGANDGSTPSIVAEIRHVMRAEITDPSHDVTAAAVSAAMCQLLAEVILLDDNEEEKLCEWEDGIRKLRCEVIGEHDWTLDHCGYWGHQFCGGCHSAKYPELAELRCSEARNQIGDINEDEYRERQQVA